MRIPSGLCSTLRIISALAAAHCLHAQAPAVPKEAQGLPVRAAPADYQAQAKAGTVTIAADFTGHGIPNAQEPLNSEDYVAVEVGLFGPADARLTIASTDFSLRINGKKAPLPSQPWGLVAKNIKDPEWVSPEAVDDTKSKGGLSGSWWWPAGGRSAPASTQGAHRIVACLAAATQEGCTCRRRPRLAPGGTHLLPAPRQVGEHQVG